MLLAPGDPPVGLDHITFAADPWLAPGMITVTLINDQAGTSRPNADGINLNFTIKNSRITVSSSAVPEPSSFVIAAKAFVLGAARLRSWRRRK